MSLSTIEVLFRNLCNALISYNNYRTTTKWDVNKTANLLVKGEETEFDSTLKTLIDNAKKVTATRKSYLTYLEYILKQLKKTLTTQPSATDGEQVAQELSQFINNTNVLFSKNINIIYSSKEQKISIENFLQSGLKAAKNTYTAMGREVKSEFLDKLAPLFLDTVDTAAILSMIQAHHAPKMNIKLQQETIQVQQEKTLTIQGFEKVIEEQDANIQENEQIIKQQDIRIGELTNLASEQEQRIKQLTSLASQQKARIQELEILTTEQAQDIVIKSKELATKEQLLQKKTEKNKELQIALAHVKTFFSQPSPQVRRVIEPSFKCPILDGPDGSLLETPWYGIGCE